MGSNATDEAHSGPLQLQFDRSVKLSFQGSSISSDGGLLLRRELDDALGLIDVATNHIADPRTGKNGRHHLAGLLRQMIFSRLAGYEDVNDADRLSCDPVMRQLIGGRAVKHGAFSPCLSPCNLERCALRPGNVQSADGWEDVLKPVPARYSADARPSSTRRRFRADAAFAIPALFDLLETEGWDYAIRINGNPKLHEQVAFLTRRPPGRPSNHVVRRSTSFHYRARS